MFIGHFAVGFAAKRIAPRTSVATLLAAAQLLDLVWPVLVLLGWEQVRIDPGNTRFTPLDFVSYPWSHSLLMSLAWATAFAVVHQLVVRQWRGTIVIWGCVVSHWVLDWVTHRPDMPLYPGGPRLGLALWNSVAGTMVVELLMFAAGLWLYMRATKARDRIGQYAFLAYWFLLLLLYFANAFGPPPPSIKAVAATGIAAAVILIPWAWWFDRHRELRSGRE
jgi:hypothetical protein